MDNGCPEKMTIHIKDTGKTIILINGMLLQDVTKTKDETCVECGRPLPVSRKRFCSNLCAGRNAEKASKQKKEALAEAAIEKFTR